MKREKSTLQKMLLPLPMARNTVISEDAELLPLCRVAAKIKIRPEYENWAKPVSLFPV